MANGDFIVYYSTLWFNKGIYESSHIAVGLQKSQQYHGSSMKTMYIHEAYP